MRAEMPASSSGNRITRGTFQIGLPGSIITLLAVFDVINWDELQTTAVLAVSYQIIQMTMNLTTWGRKIFAPEPS